MKNLILIIIYMLLSSSVSFSQIEGKDYNQIDISNIDCIKDDDVPCSFSGLSWHNDYLILLPQYPNFPKKKNMEQNKHRSLEGIFYKIDKEQIRRKILEKNKQEIKSYKINVTVSDTIKNYFKNNSHEGYEAILFNFNNVYALVELKGGKQSLLIEGTIMKENIVFNQILKEYSQYSEIKGMAKEAMTMKNSDILIFDEINCPVDDSEIGPNIYSIIGDESEKKTKMPTIPNRITDATKLNNEGNFWVTNYLYFNDNNNNDDSEILELCSTETEKSIHQLYLLNYNTELNVIKIKKKLK